MINVIIIVIVVVIIIVCCCFAFSAFTLLVEHYEIRSKGLSDVFDRLPANPYTPCKMAIKWLYSAYIIIIIVIIIITIIIIIVLNPRKNEGGKNYGHFPGVYVYMC